MKNYSKLFLLIMCLATLSFFVSCNEDSEAPIELSINDFALTISENPSGDDLSIGALDATTNRGTIQFSLRDQDPTNALQVDSETGEITIISPSLFDFETRQEVTAKAVAIVEDVADTATVTITITDVDETVLAAEDLTLTIDENPDNGEVLGGITAETANGPITYEITSEDPAGALAVDAATGQVTVFDASLFDFEARTSLTASVTLTDAINDVALSIITVNLNDIDLEELTVSDFAVTIDENPTNGDVLGTVSADSPDLPLAFSITSQTPEGAMAIDASTGELTVADASLFEFDTNPTLTATVEVTDNGGASATLTATVNLLEGDDPSFITTWTLTEADLTLTFPENENSVANFGVAYDYTIDWGDGTTTSYGDTEDGSSAEHTYAAIGTYTVKISGAYPHARFAGEAANIATVEAWGEITWYSMLNMFLDCINLQINATDVPTIAPMSSFPEGSTVTGVSMEGMLRGAVNFVGNSSMVDWNVSEVVSMNGMFRGQTNASFNEAIGVWNTDNVTNAAGMFFSNSSFNQSLTNWFQTGNLTTVANMFNSNTIFNEDISGWNMSNVTAMQFMFQNATAFNQDISAWNTGNVVDMRSVFRGATAFDQSVGAWDVTSVGSAGNAARLNNIFSNSTQGNTCGISPENYSATLNGWATQVVVNNVRLDATERMYCDGSGRQTLIDTYGWNITDAGQDPACQ